MIDMKRNYWITTHWPPEIDTQADFSIYLYEGTQQVGVDIGLGDRVWIYQSNSGRRILRETPTGSTYKKNRQPGKGGVVALMEVVNELHDIDKQPDKYEDGSERWWRWRADTKLINQSGFVPKLQLNQIMGYKPEYVFRGFGDRHSGLKKITEEIHERILQAFNEKQPPETKPLRRDPREYVHRRRGQGGEGPDHKQLKERIAANPSQVLGEDGLSLIQMEYPFPTGDRADIMLVDKDNRYVAIEVEVKVDMRDLSGVLQAIKYSRMYAIECRRKFEEVRAFLVAHQISQDVLELCKEYDIETFVIDR